MVEPQRYNLLYALPILFLQVCVPSAGSQSNEKILSSPCLIAQLPSGYYQQLKEATQNRNSAGPNFAFPNAYGQAMPLNSVYKPPRSSNLRKIRNNSIPPAYFSPYQQNFGPAPIYQFYANPIDSNPGSEYFHYAYPRNSAPINNDKPDPQFDSRLHALEKNIEKYGLLLDANSESYFTQGLEDLRQSLALERENGPGKFNDAALTRLNQDFNNLEEELQRRLSIPQEEYRQGQHSAERKLQEIEAAVARAKENALTRDLSANLAQVRKEYALLLDENTKPSLARLASLRQQLAALHKQVEAAITSSATQIPDPQNTLKDLPKIGISDTPSAFPNKPDKPLSPAPAPEGDQSDPLNAKNFSRTPRPMLIRTKHLSLEQEIDAARELLLQKHTTGQLGSFDLDILSHRLFDLANRARLSKSSATHKLSERQENHLKAELHTLLNDMENRNEER